MKPIQQFEFPLVCDAYNLAGQSAEDGQRVASEREQAESAQFEADRQQLKLTTKEKGK